MYKLTTVNNLDSLKTSLQVSFQLSPHINIRALFCSIRALFLLVLAEALHTTMPYLKLLSNFPLVFWLLLLAQGRNQAHGGNPLGLMTPGFLVLCGLNWSRTAPSKCTILYIVCCNLCKVRSPCLFNVYRSQEVTTKLGIVVYELVEYLNWILKSH